MGGNIKMMDEKQLRNILRKQTEQLKNIRKLNKRLREEIEELGITILLFEDDVNEKDKKINALEKTIKKLRKENQTLRRNHWRRKKKKL